MKKLCCPSSDNDQNVDRITHLPEPIRCHIVSLLPLLDAVRTQILSKQWRSLWSSLPALEFYQKYFEHNPCDFRDYVNQTLLSHDSSDIQEFRLTVKVDVSVITPRLVYAWITFAVLRNVQDFELCLIIPSEKLEHLPCRLFTCNTLKVLSLESLDDLNWPNVIKFPNLQSFTLDDVTFSGEDIVNTLFSSSSCPVLEDLIIRHCIFDDLFVLSINISSLKYLKLLERSELYVNLSIPNIKKIVYLCGLPPNISSENLSFLNKAHFDFLFWDFYSIDSAEVSASKVLMKVCNVERLKLDIGVMKNLVRHHNLSRYLAPSFINLKRLHLNVSPTKNQVQAVTVLLRRSPNLQFLLIWFVNEPSSSDIINMEEIVQSDESAGDNLKHLKTVSIDNFNGFDGQLDMIKYLLENASVLDEMDICYFTKMEGDEEKQMRISEEISSFNRISPHAEILIS